jgi:polyhydroxyalkanoate synthesis repressor PhaR
MTDTVIIKKYANRRLYDTQTSSYITQDDLFTMARNGEDFEVKDAKSGVDLTRQVLTQIIFEEESKKSVPLLPISFLRSLIRLYDNNMQSMVPHFLEQTIESFYNIEKNSGIEKIERAVQTNVDFFKSGMQLFNPFAGAMSGQSKQDKLRKIQYLEDEIEKLKSELEN